jgi:hypothetical protein
MPRENGRPSSGNITNDGTLYCVKYTVGPYAGQTWCWPVTINNIPKAGSIGDRQFSTLGARAGIQPVGPPAPLVGPRGLPALGPQPLPPVGRPPQPPPPVTSPGGDPTRGTGTINWPW